MSTRVAPIFPVRDLDADMRLPEDTEWGQREGVLVDPDGNVIRFGSPMKGDRAS